MSQETIDRMNSIIGGFDQRVQAAADDAWSNAAPCDGWVARDVVVHVANNLRGITAGLGGPAAGEVAPSDDIKAAWNSTRDAFSNALTTADLSANLNGPMGPMPADQLIGRLIANDVLVHTWDLARAVGGDESLPTDFVEHAYSGLKPMDAMLRRPGVFGAKVEAPAGADVQTEFLCFLGRKV